MKSLSIASAAAVIIIFFVTFVASFVDSLGSNFSDIRISLFVAGVASAVALIVVIFWAIPIHLILKRLNKLSLGWYVLAALIPGFVFVYALKPFGQDADITLLYQALFCSFSGILGAVTFWYFAVFRGHISKL